MTGPFGGNYSNAPLDLMTPLRRLFDRNDDRRRDMAKMNREHELAMIRDSYSHQNALQRMHTENEFKAGESAAQRAHDMTIHQDNKGLSERQLGLAERQFDFQSTDTVAAREHEIRMARENASQQRRTMSHGLKIGIQAQGGERTMAPGSNISVHGFSVNNPAAKSTRTSKPAASKPSGAKPTAAKPATPARPKGGRQTKPKAPTHPQPE